MIKGQPTQPFASPEEALAHYGTKGMKWGVRNKRDTSGGSSAKREAKAEKFLTKSDVLKTRISELKVANEKLEGTRNPAKLYAKSVNATTIKELEKAQTRAVKDAEAARGGKLTSAQKKAIIGGVAVAALISANALARGKESGALNSWKLQAKQRIKGDKSPFKINKDLAQKAPPLTPDDLLNMVAKDVNPDYAKMGGKMNCRRCTYAYELRRRGYDVHATTSAVGWGQSESGVINATTPGSKKFFSNLSLSKSVVDTGGSNVAKGDTRISALKKIVVGDLDNKSPNAASLSSSSKVLAELAKQPNGSRGEVMFKFDTFGHSMQYEIIGGKPHIFDAQKGTRFTSSKKVESKWDGFSAAEITRLDNVDMDLEFLTRWADNN